MSDITATKPTAGAPIDTAWGQQVHDMLEGVQSGTVSTSLSSATVSGAVAITFPRAYATPPVVVVAPVAAGGLYHACLDAAPTTTGALVRSAFRDNTAQTATIPVHWIAIGVPA